MLAMEELVARRKALDAEIAAAKAEAIAAIRTQMAELGITLVDLAGSSRPSTSRRSVKYRDGAGNTWTGVGQRPRWLKKALAEGKSLADFKA